MKISQREYLRQYLRGVHKTDCSRQRQRKNNSREEKLHVQRLEKAPPGPLGEEHSQGEDEARAGATVQGVLS